MKTVQVTLNFMGSPVPDGFVNAAIKGEVDLVTSHDLALAQSVLELPIEAMPEDVLNRYARLSTRELYVPLLPHTDKIYERLLLPLKSSKRCFCLGEFLATIELCAHVGEMLAQLVWDMESIFRSEPERIDELEKAFFGSGFEKLNQERRIRILYASRRITETQRDAFEQLRIVRRKYFHLWSERVDQLENDAERCFINTNKLIQELLQIRLSEEQPGKVAVNPRLSSYLERIHAEQKFDD